VEPAQLLGEAQGLARMIGAGPTYANAMTKRMLAMEWAMSVEEAIEAEAVAQALCMTTEDFARAYRLSPPRKSRCSRGIEGWGGHLRPPLPYAGRGPRTPRRVRGKRSAAERG
jgi:hypothetical protein